MPSMPSVPARLAELARAFTWLGLTAFGGPAAHLAIMQREFVERRGWLSRERFVDLLGPVQPAAGPDIHGDGPGHRLRARALERSAHRRPWLHPPGDPHRPRTGHPVRGGRRRGRGPRPPLRHDAGRRGRHRPRRHQARAHGLHGRLDLAHRRRRARRIRPGRAGAIGAPAAHRRAAGRRAGRAGRAAAARAGARRTGGRHGPVPAGCLGRAARRRGRPRPGCHLPDLPEDGRRGLRQRLRPGGLPGQRAGGPRLHQPAGAARRHRHRAADTGAGLHHGHVHRLPAGRRARRGRRHRGHLPAGVRARRRLAPVPAPPARQRHDLGGHRRPQRGRGRAHRCLGRDPRPGCPPAGGRGGRAGRGARRGGLRRAPGRAPGTRAPPARRGASSASWPGPWRPDGPDGLAPRSGGPRPRAPAARRPPPASPRSGPGQSRARQSATQRSSARPSTTASRQSPVGPASRHAMAPGAGHGPSRAPRRRPPVARCPSAAGPPRRPARARAGPVALQRASFG